MNNILDKESLYYYIRDSLPEYHKIKGVITLEGDKLFWEYKVNETVYDIEVDLSVAADDVLILEPSLNELGFSFMEPVYQLEDQYVYRNIIPNKVRVYDRL